MGVKVGETRCPGCGAMVPFEEGQRQATCEYCGSVVVIEGDWPTEADKAEAEMKRAEAEHQVRMKEIELAEREREARTKPLKSAARIVLYSLGAILLAAGYWSMESGVASYLPLLMLGLFCLLGATALLD